MEQPGPSPIDKKLVAGELCLDFANTVDWHESDAPVECLGTFTDLVTWSERAKLLDRQEAGRLLREAGERPGDAAGVLKRAIAVRDAIYGIALACVRHHPPEPSTLASFNRELRAAFQHLQAVPGDRGLAWSWDAGARGLDSMLWPILQSAADLFTSPRHERIGQCADDRGCGWLFLDTTKNRSRRWCLMEDCGNRAKARRHYERSRALGTPGTIS